MYTYIMSDERAGKQLSQIILLVSLSLQFSDYFDHCDKNQNPNLSQNTNEGLYTSRIPHFHNKEANTLAMLATTLACRLIQART